MLGIFAVIMFLYLSIATLLAGRTWGMSLVSIHPADVRTGLAPTTKQAVVRTSRLHGLAGHLRPGPDLRLLRSRRTHGA
ncbi:MAG: hypothetical protein WKF84_11575 [Pyrinomonadaceae bacterium]